MTQYILGMDIGGTKSHASLFSIDGQLVGMGVGGQGNPDDVGMSGFAEVLEQILSEALLSSGAARAEIIGAGFGVAGYDWPSQASGLKKGIDQLRLNCQYELVNDTVLGLLAGTTHGWGVAVVSGTGCNVRGRDLLGKEGRILGYGMEWGEGAGASEIVQRALQHIAWQWTHRGPQTRLTELFLNSTHAANSSDLLEGYILGRYKVDPGMAPDIFRLAEEGDGVSREIVRWAGESLGDLVLGVARQLDFIHLAYEIVMLGSLFKAGEALIEPMKITVLAESPKAVFKRLCVPPVAGAVMLGFEAAQLPLERVREKVIDSLKNMNAQYAHTEI